MLHAAGHGRLGGVEHGFRERAVGDVLAAIEQLGLERPALVGHSMGGDGCRGGGRGAQVAGGPGGIRGGPMGSRPLAWHRTRRGSRAPLRNPGLGGVDTLAEDDESGGVARDGDVERANWDPADRADWAEMKSMFNLDVVEKTGDWGRTPWREVASKITCPDLITADPERGAIVMPESAEEAMGIRRRVGRWCGIPNAGHNVRRDNYAPYRDAVEGFLAEVTG